MEDQKSAAQFSESPETKILWTIDDVARYARCSVRHVTTFREQGLPFRKLGHLVRFSPEAVKRWFED
jgi:excisionase family DNA binding protein